jgi:hypothetical protein
MNLTGAALARARARCVAAIWTTARIIVVESADRGSLEAGWSPAIYWAALNPQVTRSPRRRGRGSMAGSSSRASRGLEVDNQLEGCGLLHRQVARRGGPQYLVHLVRSRRKRSSKFIEYTASPPASAISGQGQTAAIRFAAMNAVIGSRRSNRVRDTSAGAPACVGRKSAAHSAPGCCLMLLPSSGRNPWLGVGSNGRKLLKHARPTRRNAPKCQPWRSSGVFRPMLLRHCSIEPGSCAAS